MKREVLVLGAGKIGGAIVDLLHATGDYRITLADSDAAFLAQAAKEGAAGQKAVAKVVDVGDRKALADLLKGKQAALSAQSTLIDEARSTATAAVDTQSDPSASIVVRSLGSGYTVLGPRTVTATTRSWTVRVEQSTQAAGRSVLTYTVSTPLAAKSSGADAVAPTPSPSPSTRAVTPTASTIGPLRAFTVDTFDGREWHRSDTGDTGRGISGQLLLAPTGIPDLTIASDDPSTRVR